MSANLVFISGASSGIGRELAAAVPFHDARVVDLSRRGAPGLDHVPADLAEPAGWAAAAAAFDRELSGFRGERAVFIHCSGTIEPMGFAGEVDPVAYQRNVLLNSAAPQILGDAWLRAVRCTSASAQLAMITSGAAHSVYEGWSSYGAGKAAVDQWVRTVGAEQERRGGRCRVISVAPGVVATPMQEEIRATSPADFPQHDRFVALHEQGELRRPDEVAQEIWSILERGFDNGSVIDLRDLAVSRSASG